MGCQTSVPKIEPQPLDNNIRFAIMLGKSKIENLKIELGNYQKQIFELEKQGKQNEPVYHIIVNNITAIMKAILELNQRVSLMEDMIFNVDRSV